MAGTLDIGGRGLEIVDLLSRAWGFLEDGGGKSVWVELDPVRGTAEKHECSQGSRSDRSVLLHHLTEEDAGPGACAYPGVMSGAAVRTS